MARWFSAGTVARLNNVVPELLVIEYERDILNQPGRVDVKFPGGKEKQENGRRDCSPLETLHAEMREEIFEDEGQITSAELVHRVDLSGHQKCFFLIAIEGKLRMKPKLEESEQGDDGALRQERLGAPHFVPVRELVTSLFRGHQPALAAIVRHMAKQNSDWGFEAAHLGMC